jgi:hypothetical protein
MDAESKSAVQLLEAVAASTNQFVGFAQRLQSSARVVSAVYGIDCRRLDTGPFLVEYVDVELQNGMAVAWWLELNWNETKWMIESRVLMNDEQGQDVLKEFPSREAETLGDCINHLFAATSDLIRRGDLLETIAQRGAG